MEERVSSFIELRDTDMSAGEGATTTKTRKSRASKRSAADSGRPSRSQSPSSTRPSGTRHSVITYSEQDANAMILKANAPPNYNGGFDGAFRL